MRDFQDFSTFMEEKQLSMAKLHDDPSEKVLHVEQLVTMLEQWSNDITAKFNESGTVG